MIAYCPATPQRWPDLERLFGPRGACAGCWCMWWRLPRAARCNASEARPRQRKLSTALASVLHDQAPDAGRVAGPGLLDGTRLAMSSFDLWRDILTTNEAEIGRALDGYIEKLHALPGAEAAGVEIERSR